MADRRTQSPSTGQVGVEDILRKVRADTADMRLTRIGDLVDQPFREVGQPTLSPHVRARQSLGDQKRLVSMQALTRPDARRCHQAKRSGTTHGEQQIRGSSPLASSLTRANTAESAKAT